MQMLVVLNVGMAQTMPRGHADLELGACEPHGMKQARPPTDLSLTS